MLADLSTPPSGERAPVAEMRSASSELVIHHGHNDLDVREHKQRLYVVVLQVQNNSVCELGPHSGGEILAKHMELVGNADLPGKSPLLVLGPAFGVEVPLRSKKKEIPKHYFAIIFINSNSNLRSG